MKDGIYVELFSVIDGERKSIKVWTLEEIENRLGVKLAAGRANNDEGQKTAGETEKAEALFCECQDVDSEGTYCTAHIESGRVLACPYKNVEERRKAEYPCSDYEPRKRDMSIEVSDFNCNHNCNQLQPIATKSFLRR